MPHLETQQATQTLYTGRVITLTRDTVTLENGETSLREVVHHHGGAGVIPLYPNGDITLVRQFRYALGRELLEIPAGKLEPGEDPFETAKRELGEEAGLAAAVYRPLGTVIPTCGYCTEVIYLYAAKELSVVARHLDEDEFVSVLTLPLAEAARRVLDGEIADSKTAVAVLKLKALHDAGAF